MTIDEQRFVARVAALREANTLVSSGEYDCGDKPGDVVSMLAENFEAWLLRPAPAELVDVPSPSGCDFVWPNSDDVDHAHECASTDPHHEGLHGYRTCGAVYIKLRWST